MVDIGNFSGDINKQGGDAFGVSAAFSGAYGEAEQCGGGGTYDGTGGSSASAEKMFGSVSGAASGVGYAVGGAGGTDQTNIGDINITT